MFFKRISILFPTHASQQTLETHAGEVFRRIQVKPLAQVCIVGAVKEEENGKVKSTLERGSVCFSHRVVVEATLQALEALLFKHVEVSKASQLIFAAP